MRVESCLCVLACRDCVVEVDELIAVVDFWGVRRRVRLDLVDEPVAVGDYVLNHVGFAIRRIPAEDVQTTLAMYEELLKANTGKGPDDLMAADVRGEIEAGGSRRAGEWAGGGGRDAARVPRSGARAGARRRRSRASSPRSGARRSR